VVVVQGTIQRFSAYSSSSSGTDRWQQQQQQQQDYSTTPPSIARAATGTGFTVTLTPAPEEPLTYTQIYEKVAPSMVSIEAQSQTALSTGTGIVLSEDGYLVTNAHVVAGAQAVRVALQNNRVLEASLVGFDADEDIAVLKVDAEGLTAAEFGDSFALQCGDPVAALGDPLGYRCTITDGIVSALDREITVDGVNMVLIQTSAAINFGNSGGALLNQYGQVVGITTIKIVTNDGSAEGLGFAIPSRRVKYVADSLIAGQTVKAGAFGFTVSRFPAEGGGLEIVAINSQSDALRQGLQVGDILLTVNGQTVTGTQDLVRLKQTMGCGDVVDVTYRRGEDVYAAQIALVDAKQTS
jgi:S1-C subfamily serine protease